MKHRPDLLQVLWPRRITSRSNLGILLAALNSCAPGDAKAGLGPDENAPASVAVRAEAKTALVGETVTVHAKVITAAGQTIPAELAWSISGGALAPTSDSVALFSASLPGVYWVRAAVSSQPPIEDSTSITFYSPPSPTVSFVLSPATVNLTTGGSASFSVLGTRADGTTFVPAVDYSAVGGTISPSGLYTAGDTAGTYRVIATQHGGSLADTSTILLTEPSPTNPNPHEPAGYNQITSQPFNTPTADGWSVDHGTPAIVADASAPISPSSILRVTYPSGYVAGYSPLTIERVLPHPTHLYWRITFRYSSNFVGHGTGVNKLGFVWTNGQPSVVPIARGTGLNPMIPDISLQGIAEANRDLHPNQGRSGIAERGIWHSMEIELISNNPGNPDGVVRWWLDGALIGQYTDVKFVAAGSANTWDLMSVYPIWGGLGGTVSAPMSVDYDDVYASGK